MKAIVAFGFILWRRNHCGCRHFVTARKSYLRTCEFYVALGIRRVLMMFHQKAAQVIE